MAFKAIAEAVQDIIQAMTRFADAEVTIGDDRVLESGRTNIVIIYPGEAETRDIAQNREDHIYTVDLDLFIRWKGEPDKSWTEFVECRDDLITELRKWPMINQTSLFIKAVDIFARDKPDLVDDSQERGPFFIYQRISAAVTEEVEISGGDYT